jgi:hypothetical protein
MFGSIAGRRISCSVSKGWVFPYHHKPDKDESCHRRRDQHERLASVHGGLGWLRGRFDLLGVLGREDGLDKLFNLAVLLDETLTIHKKVKLHTLPHWVLIAKKLGSLGSFFLCILLMYLRNTSHSTRRFCVDSIMSWQASPLVILMFFSKTAGLRNTSSNVAMAMLWGMATKLKTLWSRIPAM